MMTRIPVYLWIMCGLFSEDVEIETPETTTELMIYTCLIFLREHTKSRPRNTEGNPQEGSFKTMVIIFY